MIDKADAKGVISDAVVARLDKSHITVHTYPETHPDNVCDIPRRYRCLDLRRDFAAEGVELPDRKFRIRHRGGRLPRAWLHPRREGQAFHRPQDQFDPGLSGQEREVTLRIEYGEFEGN